MLPLLLRRRRPLRRPRARRRRPRPRALAGGRPAGGCGEYEPDALRPAAAAAAAQFVGAGFTGRPSNLSTVYAVDTVSPLQTGLSAANPFTSTDVEVEEVGANDELPTADASLPAVAA